MRDLVAAGDRAGLLDLLDEARAARVNLPGAVPHGRRTCARCASRCPTGRASLAEVTTLATELDVNIVDLEIAHSSEGPQGVL